jgi:hypothetical protein
MPVNYQLAKIYMLTNDVNDTVYVGSTAQKLLSSRMTCHRRLASEPDRQSRLYTAMKELGVDHFSIILHHAHACNSKDELEAEEYKTIQALLAMGKQLYNTRLAANETIVMEKTKHKIAAALLGRFRGDESCHFECGSQSFKHDVQQWRLEWYVNGKKNTKSLSARKYGYWEAKQMIEEHRKSVYPQWMKSPMDEAWEGLLRLEL